MKNAFSRIGYTCVFGFAIAGAMLAAPIHSVNLTLPHAVTVGSTTLPEGQVTVSTVEMNDGNGYLVVRSESGMAVTLPAQKVDFVEPGKTQITLQKDGNSWHFGKLSINGDTAGYQFTDER